MNFWNNLPRLFTVLAPMYDVTDVAFRQVLIACGRPDVFVTEFVSADGLVHPQSQEKLIKLLLRYEPNEHPIVAQLFGATPEHFERAAVLVRELGFDGVDINMGCPDKAVVKSGQGSALINNPSLAKEIILATKQGAEDIPVSVKTRTGFLQEDIEEWTRHLLETDPAVITIHARTKKDMSKVSADWDAVGKAVQVVKKSGSDTLVVGNGDVQNMIEVQGKADTYGVDGVMIGRGVFGNPWVFAEDTPTVHLIQGRLELLVLHAKLFIRYFDGIKSSHIFKRHIKNYVSGFDGAHTLRTALMEQKSINDVIALAQDVLLKIE
jgi:nifR3 family TIM-barrel protein